MPKRYCPAVVLLFTCISLSASAQGRLAELSQQISDQLTEVERNLTPRDRQSIAQSLRNAREILRNYDGDSGPTNLTCVSNGSSGAFERFSVVDLRTNQRIGGETTIANCRAIIAAQRAGLLCGSNGSTGSFEKFLVHDLQRSQRLGGETQLKNCLRVVEEATRQLVCLSNGSTGSFEKFSLFNRGTNQRVGGETTLENCIDAIPH